MENVNAIELRGLSKRFGSVIANDKITMDVRRGEILAILGENGSGKTTLMNMISGIYFPDEGQILVDGREVTIRSPRDAYELGIGMIHQHFKLIDVLSAAENIVLGLDGPTNLNIKAAYEKIRALADRYGFSIDPSQKIYEMSVSQKQTVEILKVLYRGADKLILDEPTAVLTPQEADRLFDILRNMRDDGRAIIIITHKFAEVMSLSDRVAVLRRGAMVGTAITQETAQGKLIEMMVGKSISPQIDRAIPKNPKLRLQVRDLSVTREDGVLRLKSASFDAYGGEILGIAGVAGSGQREMLEAIAGVQPMSSGSVMYTAPNGKGYELHKKTAGAINKLGVRFSFVPEDRLGMGLVGSMDIVDNMLLRSYRGGRGVFADRKSPRSLSETIIHDLEIVTPGVNTPVSKLSGGNVQKVLVGREIASNPTVLMVAYPVRGLDVNSSYTIYHLLNRQKEAGVAVLCVGEDLDVLLALCDRIMVLCGGEISGIVDARTTTKEEIGLMMTQGAGKESAS